MQVVVLSSVAILLEAALAFLGVGIPPPTPSWGEMLRTGKTFLYEAPTYAVLPGLVLTLTILSLDALGRALATVLDERRWRAATRAGRAHGMIGFVLRRLLQLVPVLLIASAGIWAMIYAVPGGPVGAIVGENATPEQIAAATQRLGLDQPSWRSTGPGSATPLHGDLGLSIQSREPVLAADRRAACPRRSSSGWRRRSSACCSACRWRSRAPLRRAPGSTGCSADGARWRWACRPSGSASC